MGLTGGGSNGIDTGQILRMAIYCFVAAMVANIASAILMPASSAYSAEELADYRDDLASWSGMSMTDQTPWILDGIYTPYISGTPIEYDQDAKTWSHVDPDGWLYGDKFDTVADYQYIGSSVVALDPTQKSSVPLTFLQSTTISSDTYETDKWWANIWGIEWIGVNILHKSPTETHTITTESMTYQYTGYRYTFDPTLPFTNEESVRDGKLSIVWWSYLDTGLEGLSGGLQVYGTNQVLLADISANDIIDRYSSVSTSTTYELSFSGTTLNLTIKFSPTGLADGQDLNTLWTTGAWTMAITSDSAGSLLDITDSAKYSDSLGSVWSSIIDVFTFDLPDLDGGWADIILWAVCQLPATLTVLLLALALMSSGMVGAILGGTLLGGSAILSLVSR